MNYKDFNNSLPYIMSIDDMDDFKSMKTVFNEMIIYYNCLISLNHKLNFDYMDIIVRSSNLNYLYKYSSTRKKVNIDKKEYNGIYTKLLGSTVTKKHAKNITNSIASTLFHKFESDSFYSNNDNLIFETFILHPVKLSNEFGESFVNHSITIYKNGLIDYNMNTTNDLFTVFKDWTVGLRLTEITMFDYKRQKYVVRHNDLDLVDFGRECFKSFLENLFNIDVSKSYRERNIDYTEYKTFQCNYIVENNDIKGKLIKLGKSPIYDSSSSFKTSNYNFHKLNGLCFFSNNYNSIIFTEETSQIIEESNNNTVIFNGLFSEFSISIWPLLVERHIDKKIIDYYSKETIFEKRDYLLFREKIKSLSVTKTRSLDSTHQTILTLTSMLSDDINPPKEKLLVQRYLSEINDYIKLSITSDEKKDDKNIQKLLLILSLLTSYSVLLDLPIPNSNAIFVGIVITALTIYLIIK